MKRQTINEFESGVYPVPLWIYLNADPEDISERFNADIGDVVTTMEKNDATTSIEKDSLNNNTIGVLLYSENVKLLTGSTIAHEAVHIADDIYHIIGVKNRMINIGDEPYAYLVGWAAKCINQARISK